MDFVKGLLIMKVANFSEIVEQLLLVVAETLRHRGVVHLLQIVFTDEEHIASKVFFGVDQFLHQSPVEHESPLLLPVPSTIVSLYTRSSFTAQTKEETSRGT